MIDKLSSIETTYEELMALLASPAVQSNAAEYRKHSKALSEIQPLVERFREQPKVVQPQEDGTTPVVRRQMNAPEDQRVGQ